MNINFMAPICTTGYGYTGLNFLLELDRQGHEVALFPIGGPKAIQAEPQHHEVIRECLEKAKLFDSDAPCVKIWHQFDMAERVGNGAFFGMPIFELDTFSDLEKHHLRVPDGILVNSQWAKYVCVKNKIISSNFIDVVPLGVDLSVFYPDKTIRNDKDKTVFLNMGKWEIRKGHDVLVKAFNQAFTSDDNVELWMCNHNPFLTPEQNKEWEDYYTSSDLGSKIKIIPLQGTHADVAKLMNQADFGVFPSRGEGWNLEALELMACGKPSIISYHSAHTEFCNEENSYLVDVKEVEPAHDGIWFKGQGNWGKLTSKTIEEFSYRMRQSYEYQMASSTNSIYRKCHENIAEGALVTAEKFSWENAAKKLVEVIS